MVVVLRVVLWRVLSARRPHADVIVMNSHLGGGSPWVGVQRSASPAHPPYSVTVVVTEARYEVHEAGTLRHCVFAALCIMQCLALRCHRFVVGELVLNNTHFQ
jgi:hypothetical protein